MAANLKLANLLRESGALSALEEAFHEGGSYGDCWYEVFPEDEEEGEYDEGGYRKTFRTLGIRNADEFQAVEFSEIICDMLSGTRHATAKERLAVEVLDWVVQTEALEQHCDYRFYLTNHLTSHPEQAVGMPVYSVMQAAIDAARGVASPV